jgi:hypothetical protein
MMTLKEYNQVLDNTRSVASFTSVTLFNNLGKTTTLENAKKIAEDHIYAAMVGALIYYQVLPPNLTKFPYYTDNDLLNMLGSKTLPRETIEQLAKEIKFRTEKKLEEANGTSTLPTSEAPVV